MSNIPLHKHLDLSTRVKLTTKYVYYWIRLQPINSFEISYSWFSIRLRVLDAIALAFIVKPELSVLTNNNKLVYLYMRDLNTYRLCRVILATDVVRGNTRQ